MFTKTGYQPAKTAVLCLASIVFVGVGLNGVAMLRGEQGESGAGAASPSLNATAEAAMHGEILARISPVSITASGMNDASLTAAYQQAVQSLDTQEHHVARQALLDARRSHDRVRNEVRRGGLSEARRARLAEAESALAAAELRWNAVSDELDGVVLDAVADVANEDAAALVARMTANQGRFVPASYRVLDLSDAAWQILETAYHNDKRGVDLSPEETAALNAAQSSPAVPLAESRLNASLADVQTAWRAEAEALLDELQGGGGRA